MIYQDEINNDLSRSLFPYIDEAPESGSSTTLKKPTAFFSKAEKDVLVATDPQFPFSLRTTRSRWTVTPTQASGGAASTEPKVQSYKTGSPVIIFMLGGLSFSEMRCTYEAAKEWNRDVFIGNLFLQ